MEVTLKSVEGKCILFATILASGMAFLDGSVVNIAIPAIQDHYGATITGIQWVINSYALMLCALILISGALGDRFGRKKIFGSGIAVFIVSSFLCSISSSITQLALFRALQGIGGAMMVPGSLSIINLAFRESVRGRVIGLWSGFAGGIAALGPFVGGWLVQTWGWPSIFLINIPLGLLALFLTIHYVPESKNATSEKIDVIGAVLIFLALFGTAYGLISVSNSGWKNPLIIGSLMSGLAFFIAFLFTERHVKEPLVPFQIFESLLVTGSNLATFFLYFALSGVIFFLVLNFQQVQHYSPVFAGLGLLPMVLLITFLSGPGGVVADKYGPRLPMIIGPLVVSFGMFLLILPGRNANYFTQYLPGLSLFGLGMALVIAPLTKSALAVKATFSGAASGVNNAVARIAGLLAVALLGAIFVLLFEQQLKQRMISLPISVAEKQQIMTQQTKLAGIDIPSSFSDQEKNMTRATISDSFIYGFRWVMGINASLALLSGIVAFFTIRAKKEDVISN